MVKNMSIRKKRTLDIVYLLLYREEPYTVGRGAVRAVRAISSRTSTSANTTDSTTTSAGGAPVIGRAGFGDVIQSHVEESCSHCYSLIFLWECEREGTKEKELLFERG
jgi:hypothetical protein